MAISFIRIVNKFTDVAGKLRVRILVDVNGVEECFIVRLQDREAPQQQIIDAAQDFLKRKRAERSPDYQHQCSFCLHEVNQ